MNARLMTIDGAIDASKEELQKAVHHTAAFADSLRAELPSLSDWTLLFSSSGTRSWVRLGVCWGAVKLHVDQEGATPFDAVARACASLAILLEIPNAGL